MSKFFDPLWMNSVRHERIEQVIHFALDQRGKPYKFGADGPDEFDCSGLVVAAYRQIGIELPHNAAEQFAATRRVVRMHWIKRKGDLVFYYHPISHVAIYLGGGYIIQAGSPSLGIARVETARYAKPVGWGRVKHV